MLFFTKKRTVIKKVIFGMDGKKHPLPNGIKPKLIFNLKIIPCFRYLKGNNLFKNWTNHPTYIFLKFFRGYISNCLW